MKGTCFLLLLTAMITEGCAMGRGRVYYQTTTTRQKHVISFGFAKADIREKERGVLKSIAELLQQHPHSVAVITGHTDNRGSDDYNDLLAENRARGVAAYLLQQGVRHQQLTFLSKGKREPAVFGNTLAAHRANRRVEIALFLVSQKMERVQPHRSTNVHVVARAKRSQTGRSRIERSGNVLLSPQSISFIGKKCALSVSIPFVQKATLFQKDLAEGNKKQRLYLTYNQRSQPHAYQTITFMMIQPRLISPISFELIGLGPSGYGPLGHG